MKFTLGNIAIIFLMNLLLITIIWKKFQNTISHDPPSIVFKADFISLDIPPNKTFSHEQSKCITHPTSYTPEELTNIFKYLDYEPCKIVGNDIISYNDGIFDIKCQRNQKPQYGTDSSSIETYGGSVKNTPRWTNDVPSIINKQFLFIRCSKLAPYAFVFNHFQQNVADSAKEIQNKLGGIKEQMSVLLFVFDSISKYSFERNLPLTNHFLQTLEENKEFEKYFFLYQFNKSAIPKPNTRPNMAQILYGKSWEEMAEEFGGKKNNPQRDYQKNAIWRHFSSLGYVTMFSHAGVFDYITAFTGKHIEADHIFTNFWRYLWGVTDIHPFQNGQKCIGGRNFHDFLFDYTYQFFNNYPNNNKFAYVHSDAAHENTGNVKTIDEDLLRFLNNFLKLIKTRKENLAIFLMSDHGSKRITGDSQWDSRTFFEFHTPFTYLIATKKIIKLQNVHENLRHNEEQLVSRYDINLSLKHLAYFPYSIPVKDWYQQAKNFYTYDSTLSLFEERVNINRTCADFGVYKEHCLCSWYEELENNKNEDKVKTEMIKILAQYLKNAKINNVCLVSGKIGKIKASDFILKKDKDSLVKLYKLEITTNKNSEIFADFNFCKKSNLVQKDSRNSYNKFFSSLVINREGYHLELDKVSLPEKCKTDFCDC